MKKIPALSVALILAQVQAVRVMASVPTQEGSKPGLKRSYTPVFGYDPKDGFLYGAGAFLCQAGTPGFNLGIYGAGNFKDFQGCANFSSVTLDDEVRRQGWIGHARLLVEKSFDLYYGEGNDTPPANPFRVSQNHQALSLSALRKTGAHSWFGPLAELRSRRELGARRVDEEGFLHLTDRLSRFSKIGGEMVPHLKVEEALREHLGEEAACVVASLPDERKGERLVALHTHPALGAEELWDRLNRGALPKLWIPKKDAIHRVDAIPSLGSGKVDLKKVKELALGLMGVENQAALPGA